MTHFRIDRDAVDNARGRLGIKQPVDVLIRRFRDGEGRYTGMRNGRHVLTVASDLGPFAASLKIWHELAHAAQAERMGGFDALETLQDREFAAAGLLEKGRDSWWFAARYCATSLEREAIGVALRQVHRRLVRRRVPHRP
jgi:hypothetical protein